ncbi:uncharacterized protein DUF3987 [Acidovorax sp. 69]|uniref:YfjI family protein n=1 Tax=Acidovorax sp. 69 TaxID=2035202 RepID=UPI000C23A53C|nr:YfjI family protein [Acidovorax sp. 69]PJI96538.1 uncharacterized protein DUF3987 [Acidovorax sp. 69]
MDDFPLNAFSSMLENISKTVQERTQAPMAMVATSLLTGMSAVNQNLLVVELPTGQIAPVGQYGGVVGDSGSGKTAVDNAVVNPIRQFYWKKSDEWRAENESKKSAQKGKKKDRKADLDDNPEPRFILSEASPEAVIYQHKDQPSIFLNSAEGGVILNGRAAKGLPLFCDGWSGSEISVDRRSYPSFTIRHPCMAILIMIQEGQLEAFMRRHKAFGLGFGFFERTEFCRPRSLVGNRRIQEYSTSEGADFWLDHYRHRITEILGEGWDRYQNKKPKLTVKFSEEAKKTWIGFSNWIERELRKGGQYEHMRGFATKAPNNIARRAANMQYFLTGDAVISDDMLWRSIEISYYYLEEHLRIFGPPQAINVIDRYSEELLGWLKDQVRTRNLSSFRLTDLYRLGPSMLRLRDDMEIAINALVERQLVLDYRHEKPARIALSLSAFA